MSRVLLKQVDNYFVYQETDDNICYIDVKDGAGKFLLRFRNDSHQYNAIHYFISVGDEYNDPLSIYLSYLFMSVNVLPDEDFLDDFAMALEDLYERIPNTYNHGDSKIEDDIDKFVAEHTGEL